MTANDLLDLIGEARPEYVREALQESPHADAPRRIFSRNRILLIAAVLALALLLAGCVALFLRLQDMSIGKETYTESYNSQGLAIAPTEGTRDILTWGGRNGDPMQLALKEWYEFLETYDADDSLQTQFPGAENMDFPEQYYHTYSCCTREMANKLMEIAEKYNLKLLDSPLTIQRYQADLFWESTGLDSLLLSETDMEAGNFSGLVYAPSNFMLDFELRPNRGKPTLYAQYTYFSKDYLHNRMWEKLDFAKVSQWDHTTSGGTQVLLALSDKGKGFILAEKDDAAILIEIDGNLSTSHYPQPEDIITKEQLEQIADAFDYSISPQPTDPAILGPKLVEREKAYQAAHTYVPERHESFAEYLLKNYRLGGIASGQFAFYDLTGDGRDDLLLGADGKYTTLLTMRNGMVAAFSVSDAYLCENGVQEEVTNRAFSTFEQHLFLAFDPNGSWEAQDLPTQIITCLTRKDNMWHQGPSRSLFETAPVSDEQAQAVMAQYPRIKLNWYPIGEFPIDGQGRTLGDYAREQYDQLSESELCQIYADFARSRSKQEYTHFLIADFNQDGLDDLWFSKNGETVYDVFSYSHGEVYGLAILDYYPCEGNVLESHGTAYMIGGVEKEEHAYYRYGAQGLTPIAYAAYNKATSRWECDKDGTPMAESEALALIARYPRTSAGLRPMEELIG